MKARLYVVCSGMELIFGGMMKPVMDSVRKWVPELEDFSGFGFGTAYMDPVYLLGELEENPGETIITALFHDENGNYTIRGIQGDSVPKLVKYLEGNLDSGENTLTLFNRFYDETHA